MNPYEIHKSLINTYVLQTKGDTAKLKRDTTNDKRDIDVLRENHKFLWDSEIPQSWEEQLAKRYYDKLFKEYCICDLKYYKHNKVALRWRIEKEVIDGRGQFSCADKNCTIKEDLRTWEVNFGYVEEGVKKNALIKLRLCIECSKKLNYRTQKREIKRLSKSFVKKSRKRKVEHYDEIPTTSEEIKCSNEENSQEVTNAWTGPVEINEKTREEEIDDYLSNLLF